MALEKRGDYYYSESQADISEELRRYSQNGYIVHHCADAVCDCGSTSFQLLMDENEGVAIRVCAICNAEHAIGDSADYLEDAELDDCECLCGHRYFEITVGVSLYDGSEDVKWLYVGCRCPSCGCTGCYGDWKNEYQGYKELLARV